MGPLENILDGVKNKMKHFIFGEHIRNIGGGMSFKIIKGGVVLKIVIGGGSNIGASPSPTHILQVPLVDNIVLDICCFCKVMYPPKCSHDFPFLAGLYTR